MITAELTIIPIGTESTSLSSYVAAAVDALDKIGIKYQLSGMGTQIESDDPQELFKAIEVAHEAVFAKGADRVSTSIKIDDRRDKDRSLADKVLSVEKKL